MTGTARKPITWIAAVVAAALATALSFVLVGSDGGRRAAAAVDTNPDVISVTGVGTADGAPDTLTAEFTVRVTRDSVQSALDAQAAATSRLFANLQHSGVARRDLQTTDLSIDRHYDNNGNVTGYDAGETVRAKISPLSRAGRVISAGATASGNDVEVGQLAFDITNDTALVSQARAAAFADAKSRAEQYAGLADRSLGRVEKVTETVSAPDPMPYYASGLADSAGKASAVPLRPGQQTLTVNVTVVWALS